MLKYETVQDVFITSELLLLDTIILMYYLGRPTNVVKPKIYMSMKYEDDIQLHIIGLLYYLNNIVKF